MSLTTLVSSLVTQVNANATIVLDSSILSSDAISAIQAAFALGTETNLTISGISASDIIGPLNNKVTIKAGTTWLFNQTDLTITVEFTELNDTIEAVIYVTMGSAWTFPDSFPSLANFPFKLIDFSGAGIAVPQFVYTTAQQDNYQWPGYANPSPITLTPGLWFFSQIGLTSLPPIVSTILGTIVSSTPVNFYGPFSTITGQKLPVGKIMAELGSGMFSVGSAPNTLSLNTPSIVFCITPATPPLVLQRLQLLIRCVFNQTLDVDIAIPASGNMFALSARPQNQSTSILTVIESLPGGSNFSNYIPSELETVFSDIELESFSMVVDTTPSVKSIGFAITTLQPWTLIPEVLELENLILKVSIIEAMFPTLTQAWISATAQFFPNVFPGDFDFTVNLQGTTTYTVSSVSGYYAGFVKLSDLVSEFLPKSLTVPTVLQDISFSDFGLTATRTAESAPWAYTFSGSIETAFPVLGTELSSLLYVNVTTSKTSHDIQLAGGLVIGEQSFSLALDLGTMGSTLNASWENDAEPLGLDALVSSLGFASPPIPATLDLGLKTAALTIDFSPETLIFIADSVNYGKAALVAAKNSVGSWGYIFGVDVGLDLDFNLSDIPLIGTLVPAGDNMLGLKDLRIVAATAHLPVYTTTADLINVLGNVVSSGLALTIELQLGASERQSFSLSFDGASASSSGAPLTPDSEYTPTAASPTSLSGDNTPPITAQSGQQVTWVNVQRAFGPMQINRVGFTIVGGNNVAFFLDGEVSLGGLSIGLTGLEAEMAIQTPVSLPTFNLAGLQIQYNAATLSIGGGLEKVRGSSQVEYTGELALTFGNFGATALGSYTTTNGQPSLFAFIFINTPLGGPPCFFVTGLAGGFGYNRSLKLPTIANVAQYPLVQGAMGKLNATNTQTQLETYIQLQQNENWFAAGVCFTSFEMVKSFALLTVSFGTTVEIALMGKSTLIIPVSTVANPQAPVAEADLLVLVDIQVSNGLIAVNAQLSPSSYVFSHAAQLTGGFSFYLWFGSSPYAGDYVVTLGGYNPYFTAPDYYPQVPQLGLNWQVSSELTVKGGLYFALTPSVIMAGGSLRATWQSGGIKAWFNAEADFLIRYKPFTYLIHVSISIGVSVKVDLWITSFTVTLHLGVDLTLWGPSFGGVANISLYIVSFTLGFGSSSPPNGNNIGWAEFRDSFLPPVQTSGYTLQAQPAMADTVPTQTDSLITITAPTGILSTFSQSGATIWSVSAGKLQLAITTLVPSTIVKVTPTTTVQTNTAWTTILGVGPMGAIAGSLVSTLTISFERDTALDDDDWTASAMLSSVPAGMWFNTSNKMQTDGTVSNVLVGISLIPTPPTGGITLKIPIQELLADDPPLRNYAWSSAKVPQDDHFDQTTAMLQLQNSLVNITITGIRANILNALQKQGLSTAKEVNVSGFAQNAPDLLHAPPILLYLGEASST